MNFPKPKQSVLTSTSPLAWTGCALQTASVGLPLAVFASSEIFKKFSLNISPNSPCQVSRWTWIFSLFFLHFSIFGMTCFREWNDFFQDMVDKNSSWQTSLRLLHFGSCNFISQSPNSVGQCQKMAKHKQKEHIAKKKLPSNAGRLVLSCLALEESAMLALPLWACRWCVARVM